MNSDVSALLGLLSNGAPIPVTSTGKQLQHPASNGEAQNKQPPGPGRDKVLQLIARQLADYGLTGSAELLAKEAKLDLAEVVASSELSDLVHSADANVDDMDADVPTDDKVIKKPRLALESIDAIRPARTAPNYISWFATQHKGAVLSAAFSADGSYFATSSADHSLKVLDITKIHACRKDPSIATADKPAIRTFYDHQAPATDVAFHPNGAVLASCSQDMTIKLYDLQKVNMKRGYRYLQDACGVRCISFHPSGDFLLAGTDHEVVRIYDLQTFKCYKPTLVAGSTELQGSITKAKFSPSGNAFATSSTDGTIRIYDGVSGKLVNTILQAHGGASVSSVEFSQSGKFLLSCGLDSLPRLWDLSSGRVMQTFEGTSQRNISINAVFSQKDELVLSVDDSSNMVATWDTKSGTLLNRYSSVHVNAIRSVFASPIDSGFVTVSDDCRARYWHDEAEL